MKLTLSAHGIFALIAVIVMFAVAFVRRWDIPWIYFVLSVAAYGIAGVVSNLWLEETSNEGERLGILRVIIGCHIAFVLAIVGLTFLPSSSVEASLGYLIASAAGGLGISFLLLRATK